MEIIQIFSLLIFIVGTIVLFYLIVLLTSYFILYFLIKYTALLNRIRNFLHLLLKKP